MAIGILSHTFPMTHRLTLVSKRGERRHYRTDDGRDILAKPTGNPAHTDGLMYWYCDYSPDIEPWLAGRIG